MRDDDRLGGEAMHAGVRHQDEDGDAQRQERECEDITQSVIATGRLHGPRRRAWQPGGVTGALAIIRRRSTHRHA